MTDNDMRIVPERDEVHPRARSRGRATTDKPKKSNRPSSEPRAGGGAGNRVVIWLLCILVVGLSGASAWLYLQTQTLNQQRETLAQRVADIESRLSVTDESMSQSGAALQAALVEHRGELDEHMSEIRKLWGVAYDRNRVAIETLKTQQKNSGARMDSMAGSLAKLDPVVQGYQGFQSRLETMASQLLVQSANIDDQSSQLRDLTDQQGQTSTATSRLRQQLDGYQEAIDSFDEYRFQTNQRLRKLEQPTVSPSTESEQ